MSDALPLPPRPNVEQYRKLAKDFQRACRSTDPSAIRDWARRWLKTLTRLRGVEITDEVRRWINREAGRIEQRWTELGQKNPDRTQCRLTDAQFFIAREHEFASWPKFAAHIEGLMQANSPVSNFEAAADAIVDGDTSTLKRLLNDHPELARERSTRDHRSTLLHYVSANGVEDFRQKTPPNILEITRILLDAGADVNAESDAYAGGSTTLGLTATSIHPEQAGVQIPLLELLLDRGSRMDQPSAPGHAHSVVAGCFANGQPEAARYLVSRGAPVDFEGAAALGELSLVQSYFDEHGRLKPPATEAQMKSAFVYASGYGRKDVVNFLLQRGIDPRDPGVRSSLHWAVYGAHPDILELLLKAGAPVNVRHERRQFTPLEVALFPWVRHPDEEQPERVYDVVRTLVAGGAKLDPQWFEQDDDRRRLAQAIGSNSKLQAALGGQVP
jgi:ankyrin repeat protein